MRYKCHDNLKNIYENYGGEHMKLNANGTEISLITDTKSNEDYISLTDIANTEIQMIHLVLLRIGCETETQ